MRTPPPLESPPPERPDTAARVTLWQFGQFEVDAGTRELRRGAQLLKTTPKMFDLLCLLLRNRHRVVPHAELLQAIWPRVHVSPGVLPQMVRKLRVALDDMPGRPQHGWIQGTRGVGYRFAGDVRERQPVPADVARNREGGTRLEGVPAGLRDQVLYEQGRDQIWRDNLEGLARTIAELRAPEFGGGSRSHRRCLVWADIFECHLERVKGNSRSAWHHLESAQLLLEGLEEPHLQCELRSMRGLYFETFMSEADALPEFEAAWALAQGLDHLQLRAGCAARLAFAFGRTRNWPAFEQWSKTALQLAAQQGSRATWLRHTVQAAMGWMEMGYALAAAGDGHGARQAWSRSLQLNESVLGEPADADVAPRTRFIARVNRHLLLVRLHPERLAECLAVLQDCLEQDTRPLGRIQLQRELVLLLRLDGQHAQARTLCLAALAACEADGLPESRDALLLSLADICEALGDLAGANAALRELLKWRSAQAAEKAQRAAAITAVRLDTERALALAQADRERVEALTQENSALRRRAALLERGAGTQAALEPGRFERHLGAAWSDARARGRPQCVALVAIDQWRTPAGHDGEAPRSQRLRGMVTELLEVCRGADLVAPLQQGDAFGVVFDMLDLPRAMAVCQRIGQALRERPGAGARSASVVVADVSRVDDPASALGALRGALAEAQAAGGNCVRTWAPAEAV